MTSTALVLQDVHSDWGQAESVSGLVNTAGWEDGVTITPNGEYLFIQTGPYRWSSLLVYSEPRSNGAAGMIGCYQASVHTLGSMKLLVQLPHQNGPVFSQAGFPV